MRLAVIHNLAPGGARRRLQQQLQHLTADAIEICLEGAAPVTGDPIVVPCRPLAPTVPRVARPPLRYADVVRLWHSWRRARAEIERVRPDVVFANPCRFLQAPAALVRSPAPSLYFCDEPRASDQDPLVRASRSMLTRRLYGGVYAAHRFLDRAATLAATRLATNSRYTASWIGATYGRSAEVLPMGVPDMFTPTFAAPRHLLSVGTLIPDKGHELVLEAAARAATRWPVVVVAPRPAPEAERELMQSAASFGIDLTVRTAIDDTQLVQTYRLAVATLYLARTEPFGLASLEAQACGSPVIVAAEGGLPETLIDGVSGWVVSRNATEAAARIDALADDALRGQMAHAAAGHGAEHTWSRAGAALERLLTSLALRSAHRR